MPKKCLGNTPSPRVLINLIAALDLNLLIGFTGLLSLGHAAFLGIEAYTSALLITHLGMPLLLASSAADW